MKTKICVSIKNNGQKKIKINGKKVGEYDEKGVMLEHTIIAKMNINHLSLLDPIVVEFESARKDKPQLAHLYERVTSALTVKNETEVEAFVTIMSPVGLSAKEHEEYQLALQEVVENDKELTLYEDLAPSFDDAMLVVAENYKTYKRTGEYGENSAIGYVQFLVTLKGYTYNDIFVKLNNIVKRLDSEATKRI